MIARGERERNLYFSTAFKPIGLSLPLRKGILRTRPQDMFDERVRDKKKVSYIGRSSMNTYVQTRTYVVHKVQTIKLHWLRVKSNHSTYLSFNKKKETRL